MKVKHNKKRNVAFVYEALIRATTVAVVKQEHDKKDKILEILRKHFAPGTELRKDLDCYRSLYENQGLDKQTAERILRESRIQKSIIDSKKLFEQQSDLIRDINKDVTADVFNYFVPNYRTLASISQIFSDKISPKNKVILENEIVNNMQLTANGDSTEELDYVDNIVYKSFVEKFNEKYEDTLLTEQKELLTYYISSFSDNALELKTFLNEEIGRLKKVLAESRQQVEFTEDKEMLEKLDSTIDLLGSFSQAEINENVLRCVLKTQKLAKELL